MKSICFSATASFSAGVALLVIGTVTIRRAEAPVEVPYAVIPLIFGVQQLVEGGLWLVLPEQTQTTSLLTAAYLLFSNVLWPIYVPLAVWMIEPSKRRRRIILFPMAAGAAISLFFVVAMITHPVWAEIKGGHIKYHLPHPHHKIAFAIYLTATGLAPLLSSYKTVKLFGVALIAASIAARFFFSTWFASVWCFFAALISGVVFLHFWNRRAANGNEPTA